MMTTVPSTAQATNVPVFANERQTQPENFDNRSHISNQSSQAPSRYLPPSFGNNNSTNSSYCEQYVVESFNSDNSNKNDYLPEGSVLIEYLNDKKVALYALCLFDSGSSNTLINQCSLPPFVEANVGTSQAFTTTQGTYNSSEYFMGKIYSFLIFVKLGLFPRYSSGYSIV